jgi:AbrB family looped-hinge helix DNA binding protein
MKITQKGQITIPNEIRKTFDLHPNTEVEFIVKDNQVILRKRKSNSSKFSHLIGKAELSLSTEEIMDLTRGES